MAINKTVTTPINGVDIQAIIAQAVSQAVAQSTAPLAAEVARLKAENAKLATAPVKPVVEVPLTMQVSLKGALSVYGLGRFPFTLYKSQWVRLLKFAKSIEKFLVDNDKLLKNKSDKD
jgi:hypothetical protein